MVIELRACFDEAANIELPRGCRRPARRSPASSVWHAKMLLIVRREGNELRRYPPRDRTHKPELAWRYQTSAR